MYYQMTHYGKPVANSGTANSVVFCGIVTLIFFCKCIPPVCYARPKIHPRQFQLVNHLFQSLFDVTGATLRLSMFLFLMIVMHVEVHPGKVSSRN